MSGWRPADWALWKRKALANLSPAKATLTDDVLVEQVASHIVEALEAAGEVVKDANALDWMQACDHLERKVTGPGVLVFIPQEKER